MKHIIFRKPYTTEGLVQPGVWDIKCFEFRHLIFHNDLVWICDLNSFSPRGSVHVSILISWHCSSNSASCCCYHRGLLFIAVLSVSCQCFWRWCEVSCSLFDEFQNSMLAPAHFLALPHPWRRVAAAVNDIADNLLGNYITFQ